jgi:hypothetical protein
MSDLSEKLAIYLDLLATATPLVEESDRTYAVQKAAQPEDLEAAKAAHNAARYAANRAMEEAGEALSAVREAERSALAIYTSPTAATEEEEELLAVQRATALVDLKAVGRALRANSLYQRHIGIDAPIED